jgi:DNA polymerase-1
MYRGVFEFKENKEQGLDARLRRGDTITNFLGRKYRLVPEDVHMKGLNTLIQSSAHDLLMWSSLKIKREFKRRDIDARVLLWVHDEIVVEAPDDRLEECEEIIRVCMTDYRLPSPMGMLPLKIEGKTEKFWSK